MTFWYTFWSQILAYRSRSAKRKKRHKILIKIEFSRACMLHAALIYGFLRVLYVCVKKKCVSVRWITLWVRPPLCVRSFGNTVGTSPPCVCLFVRLHCGCFPPVCPLMEEDL